jgi:sulfur carrier protein
MKTQINSRWILINGDIYSINFRISIGELLEFFDSEKKDLIIEYNQKILSKEEFDNTFLKNFDKLELISVVGGG